MPVGALLVNKDVKVKRSPSLRSESNQSSLSDSRHVSFNQDVSIKRIPKKIVKVKSLDPNDEFHQKCHQFVNIPPPSDKEQIEDEAQQILKHLDDIECSVSPSPRITSPVRQLVSPSPRPDSRQGSRQGTPVGSRQGTLERIRGNTLLGRLSKSSSDLLGRSSNRLRAMRVEGTSEQEDSPGPDSRFYGLQALSNLDNAVNGKVNNLYRDSSGSIDYSPPPKKNNLTPPKPPRKAPSASPPSLRKGYASHDELDFRSKSRNEMYESNQKKDFSSYAGGNPSLNHLRESPTRLMSSRQSPSRGNLTDTEILSSPTQVLYATISADKHKHNGNLKNQHIQTQTVQTGFRPISAERQIKPWSSSKENILDDPPYRFTNANNGSSKHASRSLERFVDDDKENSRKSQELKARIHVSSPMRYSTERPANGSRKPYKTTINTATDTIQYKGFTSDNLVDKNDPRYKQKNVARHPGKKMDTEHYKVPKNKAPVPAELIARKGRTSSEYSSSAYNGNYHVLEKDSNLKSQFASTSLVRNAVSENRQKRGEYDREGRRIQSSGRSGERNRAYSGYSTSPDREMSPDRYAKPRAARMASPRSPSSSPQRPPRTRASPNREVIVPIRQEHSGREVERSPSTRAAATSRSPIKKIQRVHNEIKDDKSGGGKEPSPHQTKTLTLTKNRGEASGVRGVKKMFMKKQENNEDDRLSKFTEYRGGGGGGGEEPPLAPNRSQSGGRRGSTGFELRRELSSGDGRSEGERERGASVPPGANIDSMRDFYKTSQYRSMYHLPPSPSRPAPVLERAGTTLERPSLRRGEDKEDAVHPPPRRHAKTSISEGEMTDDQARVERVQRQRSKFLNNMMSKGEQSTQGQNRRVVSSDRDPPGEPKKILRTAKGEPLNNHRNGSYERPVRRPAPQPPTVPTQRVRRSSVDVLETSHSESESPRPDQAKLAAESGRWPGGQSDIETDYRQQMATNSVHMEARGRSGEMAAQVSTIYQQAATLNKNKSPSKTKLDSLARGRSHDRSVREVEISQDDDEDEVVRAPTNLSREDERRKIIELEEERRRKEIRSGNVARSGSRGSKSVGGKTKGPRLGSGDTETDAQSQYSGHSAPNLKSRYSSNGRVKRTGSGATTNSARQMISRKKMPGSLTSSINSSESENGQSAISRATGTSAASNRSVFLHATAVAAIPSNKPSGGDKGQAPVSNLQKSKKISRSISLLTPFKKNQGPKEKEVIYDSSGQVVSGGGKPPRAPPAPVRRLPSGEGTISKEKKFASSSDLLQDGNEVVMAYPQQDPQGAKNSSRVSRSVSMPKDTRLAGWFKKRKRV